MVEHKVTFAGVKTPVIVPSGSLLIEAAKLAKIDVLQPCGGQGRCGRCIVQVKTGKVRQRSKLHLSSEELEEGFVLACQTVVEGDIVVVVPPQEKIERKLSSDRIAEEVSVPIGYDPDENQTSKRIYVQLTEPNLEDKTDDYNRLLLGLKQKYGISSCLISLPLLKNLGKILRDGKWEVSVVLDIQESKESKTVRLIDILPGYIDNYAPLWGVAVDIGTTTVTVWLIDLITGKVHAQTSEYNNQISRGEDVISRIIYANNESGIQEMQQLVLKTINELINMACKKVKEYQVTEQDIVKVMISGNSTMIHFLLGIPAESIRLSPFITAINHIPIFSASDIGINVCPQAIVDCLPGVASYVGSDISAGVYAIGMDSTEALTLFMDVGTNGEIVLGSRQWLVTCACSAGPAFEGAGVSHGMRATKGAIEEVWISHRTYEPTYRVIGNVKPKGICGSGLLSLLAEMFMTGIIDRAGNIDMTLSSPRIREGSHGPEYVVAWENETEFMRDIVISHVDIDNLIRAKAAIYAGFTVLSQSVGIPLQDTEQIIIGGSFGKYINIEKAIQIGLLPDLPWEKFKFLGNTSILGTYYAILNKDARSRIDDIASRMTYIELSADNSFYNAFMSALFLPHTDINNFPSVEAALELINPPNKQSA